MSNISSNLLLWLIGGLLLGLVISFLVSPSSFNFGSQNQSVLSNQNNSVSLNTSTSSNITVSGFSQILILAPNCDICNTVDSLQSGLASYSNSSGIVFETPLKIDSSSDSAKTLISKYSITKLPALVLLPKGQVPNAVISDLSSSGFENQPDGSLLFREIRVPYFDIPSSKSVGFVSGIAIRADSCQLCMDPNSFFATLEQSGIDFYFTNKTILNESDPIAQNLISTNNITKLPVLLLDSGASYYPSFNLLSSLGSIEGKWFVLRNVSPPYTDLTSNHSIKGLIHSIVLVNSSCSDCFNASALSDYISGAAHLYISNSTTLEVNSTAAHVLIVRYNITHIPTVLYSPETSLYPSFSSYWANQGSTIENDGWFVFRSHNLLANATYQNMSN